MFYIENMLIAPILGSNDQKTIKIAKKLAEAYNKSIHLIDDSLFLGFKMSSIPELQNATASFNFEKRMLEINVNEYSQILIPSRHANFEHINEYFEFNRVQNISSEIILEKSLNKKRLLSEDFTFKGKGDSLFKSISSGIESAKKIFRKEIKIENAESIERLAENIASDLQRILKINVGTSALIQVISNFVITGDASKINDLYNVIYENTIQSAYIDGAISDIHKLIVVDMKDGEFFGRTKDSDIISSLAKSYGDVDEKTIKSRMKSPKIIKKIKSIKAVLDNAFNFIISAAKGFTFSLAGFYTLWKGVGALIFKIVSLILKTVTEIVQYLLGGSTEIAEDSTFLERLTFYKNWIVEKGGDAIENISSYALEKTGDISSKIESLDYICVLKYALGAFLLYVALKNIKSAINSYFGLTDEFSTENERLAARISEEQLSNNFGFDKIVATEGIITVLISHIQHAIENDNFNEEEKKRLKGIVRAFYSSHKIKTDEGIKFLFKGLKDEL